MIKENPKEKRRIAIIPSSWKHKCGNLSIHQVMIQDALLLSDEFDVTIFESNGFGFPESNKYTIIRSEDKFTTDLPIGSITPELGVKIGKWLNNQTIILVYDPIMPMQIGGLFFNHFISRPFLFPKFVYRFISDVPGTTREQIWKNSFITILNTYPVIWNSEQAKLQGRNVMIKNGFLRPKEDFWSVVNLNIDIEGIDKALKTDRVWLKPKDKFVVRAPWNRLAEAKQPELFFAVMSKMNMLTKGKSLGEIPLASQFIMQGDKPLVEKLQNDPSFKVLLDHHKKEDREGYYASLNGAHAYLSTSKSESFGLAQLEALMAGLVGVYLNVPKNYTEFVLPKYPFNVAKPDLIPTLMWVQDNYEEAQKMVEPFRQYVRENYSKMIIQQRFVNEINNLFKYYVDRIEEETYE